MSLGRLGRSLAIRIEAHRPDAHPGSADTSPVPTRSLALVMPRTSSQAAARIAQLSGGFRRSSFDASALVFPSGIQALPLAEDRPQSLGNLPPVSEGCVGLPSALGCSSSVIPMLSVPPVYHLVYLGERPSHLVSLVYKGSQVVNGAPGRDRTSTPVKATDFESAASTNSATGALPGSGQERQRTIRGAACASTAPEPPISLRRSRRIVRRRKSL